MQNVGFSRPKAMGEISPKNKGNVGFLMVGS